MEHDGIEPVLLDAYRRPYAAPHMYIRSCKAKFVASGACLGSLACNMQTVCGGIGARGEYGNIEAQ